MDMEKEMEKIESQCKRFNYLIGKEYTKARIFEFNKPIKKRRHEKTLYYYFNAEIEEIDGKKVLGYLHTLQIPAKTIVLQIYKQAKKENKLNQKHIDVEIRRTDNFNFSITLLPYYEDTS